MEKPVKLISYLNFVVEIEPIIGASLSEPHTGR